MVRAWSAWLASKGCKLATVAVAVAAAAAFLTAPAALATNGGPYAYLPEEQDWCLGMKAPELTDVGSLHAFARLEYRDTCLFPAKASIEIRSGDGGWQVVDREFTKSSDRQDKKWTVRTIRLGDLRNNTRYWIRSRIDYGTNDAHTSDLTFRTGGDPAREMHAEGTISSGQNDPSIFLTAIIPDTGKNTPTAIWVAPQGFEQFSNERPWEEETPFATNLKRDCHAFTEHYSKCTWQFKWRVSIGVPRPVPAFMWKYGLEYRVHFCITNPIYSDAFGSPCTKEFSVLPGKASQVDVGQAP